MGFAFKTPKISAGSVAEPHIAPAVVTETVDTDTIRNYDQKRANKRGLLSTILSDHNRSYSGGNTTLG